MKILNSIRNIVYFSKKIYFIKIEVFQQTGDDLESMFLFLPY